MLASRNHLNPSKNNKANSSVKTDRKKEKQIKKAKEENPKHIKVKKTKQCDNNEDFEWSYIIEIIDIIDKVLSPLKQKVNWIFSHKKIAQITYWISFYLWLLDHPINKVNEFFNFIQSIEMDDLSLGWVENKAYLDPCQFQYILRNSLQF